MISTFLLCLVTFASEPIRPVDITCSLVTTDYGAYVALLTKMLNDDSVLVEYVTQHVEVKYYRP